MDAQRRRDIEDSLARAAQALAVADAALALGSSADALSRTYYGALHFVRALLLARGWIRERTPARRACSIRSSCAPACFRRRPID